MNPAQVDEIEARLREQFDGPIVDGGFSDRVMRQLPHRRRRASWPLWIGILAGTAAGWLALLPSPLLRTGWHDSVQGTWSAALVGILVVMLVLVMLALVWAVAEADNR